MTKSMKQAILEASGQLVIQDAMEKGHTNKAELMEYMKSETFSTAVKSYFDMFVSEFDK